MKKLSLFLILLVGQTLWAQKNFIDQPYLETSASADTLVTPDRIYMSILLSEAESKNRTSVEEQEQKMQEVLKKLGIDTKKDLQLDHLNSYSESYFLRGKNVIKQKRYILIVRDAVTAGRVFAGLEQESISKMNITKTEYSKSEEILLSLKTKAMKDSKITATKLAQSIGQHIGKAIQVSDQNFSYAPVRSMNMMYAKAEYEIANSIPEPIDTDFKKIKFQARVQVVYQLLD